MKRITIAIGILLVSVALLSACGRKAPPEAPGENQYPRPYPAPR